jgi:poly(A) polymerase
MRGHAEKPIAIVAKLEASNWLHQSTTRAVFASLEDGGHDVRAVGGCVRNSLLGQPVKDIDFATTAKPEETIKAAEAAGLKAIPTGIEHGTITIVADGVPHEVTTLRRDVETDGRRATVAFTDDWREDASRRDFTLNALYADKAGNVYDPVDGYGDLRAGRIRFIGDASERIREDYLRILRFFRFSGYYGGGQMDEVGLAACVEQANQLSTLAGERIQSEMKALMLAPAVTDVAATMQATGLFAHLLNRSGDIPSLIRLIAVEKTLNTEPDPLRRLAALFLHTAVDADHLRQTFKLSNKDADRLHAMVNPNPATEPGLPEQNLRAHLYRSSSETFQDQLLLTWARSETSVTDQDRTALFHYGGRWQPPAFPLQGEDVLALGVEPGPQIGAVLASVEAWWVEHDFKPSRDILIDKLHERLKG